MHLLLLCCVCSAVTYYSTAGLVPWGGGGREVRYDTALLSARAEILFASLGSSYKKKEDIDIDTDKHKMNNTKGHT